MERITMKKAIIFHGISLVLVLLLCSCASNRRLMRQTPFTSQNRLRMDYPGEQNRTNLWPLYYHNNDFYSVMWPFFDLDSKGWSLRPFYNRDGNDYSVLFPLCGWENTPDRNVGWCLNYLWKYRSDGTVGHFLVPFITYQHTYALLSGKKESKEKKSKTVIWAMPYFYKSDYNDNVTESFLTYYRKSSGCRHKSLLLPLWFYKSMTADGNNYKGQQTCSLTLFPLFSYWDYAASANKEYIKSKLFSPLVYCQRTKTHYKNSPEQEYSKLWVPGIPLFCYYQHSNELKNNQTIHRHCRFWLLLYYQSRQYYAYFSTLLPFYIYSKQDPAPESRKLYDNTITDSSPKSSSLYIPLLFSCYITKNNYFPRGINSEKCPRAFDHEKIYDLWTPLYSTRHQEMNTHDQLTSKITRSANCKHEIPASIPFLFYNSQSFYNNRAFCPPHDGLESRWRKTSYLFPFFYYSTFSDSYNNIVKRRPLIRKSYATPKSISSKLSTPKTSPASTICKKFIPIKHTVSTNTGSEFYSLPFFRTSSPYAYLSNNAWSRGIPIVPFLYYQSADFNGLNKLWILPYYHESGPCKQTSSLLPLWYYSKQTPEHRRIYEALLNEKKPAPATSFIIPALLSGYIEKFKYLQFKIGIEREIQYGALLYSKSAASKTILDRISGKTTTQEKWSHSIPAWLPLLYYQAKGYDDEKTLWTLPYYRYRSKRFDIDLLTPFWYQATVKQLPENADSELKRIFPRGYRTWAIPLLGSYFQRSLPGNDQNDHNINSALTTPFFFEKKTERHTNQANKKQVANEQIWIRGVPYIPFLYYHKYFSGDNQQMWLFPYYSDNNHKSSMSLLPPLFYYRKYHLNNIIFMQIYPLLYFQYEYNQRLISVQFPLWYFSRKDNNKFLWAGPWISRTNGNTTDRWLIPLFYSSTTKTNNILLSLPGVFYRHHKFKDYESWTTLAPLWYSDFTPHRDTVVAGPWFSRTSKTRKKHGLIPLYFLWEDKYRTNFLSLPGFYLRNTKKNQAFYSSFLWPLIKYEQESNGKAYWRFWPLISREKEMGFPAIFDYASNYKGSSWRFLWFFVNCEKDYSGKLKNFSILNRLFRYNRERDVVNIEIFPGCSYDSSMGKSSFSILGGLFSYQNIHGKRNGKVLFIPWGND